MSSSISSVLSRVLHGTPSMEASPVSIPCGERLAQVLATIEDAEEQQELQDTIDIANTFATIGDVLVQSGDTNTVLTSVLDIGMESLFRQYDAGEYDTTSIESRVTQLRLAADALEADVLKTIGNLK